MKQLELFDSHTHLNDPRFSDDLAFILDKSWEGGVSQMLVAGYNEASSRAAVEMTGDNNHPSVAMYAAVGISPHEACAWNEQTDSMLAELSHAVRVVAIGETGLDYHYEFSPRKTQQQVFEKHLALAQACGLPVVVHLREAEDDLFNILKTWSVIGVMHCFTSTPSAMRRALDIGFYLSLAGIVTFKNSSALREVAKLVPTDRLLIETDCPYLAPQPFRGKRCEPWMLRHTAEVLAEVREVPLENLATQTTANARKLFGIDER